MHSLDSLNRVPKIYCFFLICWIISGGCTSGEVQSTQISNQLTIPEIQFSKENRVEIAKNIRTTVQSDPCVEDIVLGLPEESWRCSNFQTREKPEASPNSPEQSATSTQEPTEIIEYALDTIQWDEAYQYVDQYIMVCGPVVDSYFAASTEGQPTFLNLGKEYPDPDRFTVLIWGSNLESFPFNPDEYYYGKSICVEGKIVEYQGSLEIEARKPGQIEVR